MKRAKANQKKKQQFSGVVFYLDLRCNPSVRNKLSSYIKTLGGHVETFFDKRINYVITDKPRKEWPGKGPSTGSNMDINSTDSRDSSCLNGGQGASHSTIVDLYSRGKRLAMKAGTANNTTTDILELAYKSGVKLLPVKQVCLFCESVLNGNEVKETPEKETSVKLRYLRLHYIKFEDNRSEFRPHCREWDNWPDVNIQAPAGSCPFGTARMNAAKLHNKESKGAKSEKSNDNASAVKASQKPTKTTSKPTRKQKIAQFCEICSEAFSNTFEHIATAKHQKFVNNSENYSDLLGVINSLPKWLNGDTQPSCCDSSEEMDEAEFLSTPPLTSPTTATTFTLVGVTKSCGNSGAFLRLDDCIRPARLSQTPPPLQVAPEVPADECYAAEMEEAYESSNSEEKDYGIVEASSITPTKDPLGNLKATLFTPDLVRDLSEQF